MAGLLSKHESDLLADYEAKLHDHAKLCRNDVRHCRYATLTNRFLKHFNKEKVHVVGSTGENLKLKERQQDGDTDILFCSGRLEIPVANIEVREDFPCYIKIRGNDLPPEIVGDLIEGRYLSADTLKEVRPELFTLLRSLIIIMTTARHTRYGVKFDTTTSFSMKVGLTLNEFKNLQVEGMDLQPKLFGKRIKLERSAKCESYLKRRWSVVERNDSDTNMITKILKILQMNKKPNGDVSSLLGLMAETIENVMKRKRLDIEKSNTKDGESNTKDGESNLNDEESNTKLEGSYTKDEESKTKDKESDTKHEGSNTKDEGSNTKDEESNTKHEGSNTLYEGSETKDRENDTKEKEINTKDEESNTSEMNPEVDDTNEQVESSDFTKVDKVKATYTNFSTKDFVPALRILTHGEGRVQCLVDWEQRVEKTNWPPKNVVHEILRTDLFVVARVCPVKPNKETDFCLSFNLAEMMLAHCFTDIQRRVYLILKSYLKGAIAMRQKELGMENTFKTFFLKTAFFWVCEINDSSLWRGENVIGAVKTVLDFLLQCLRKKNLEHYFAKSNLFAGMGDLENEVLQECFYAIKRNPIENIKTFPFSDKDFNRREETWLSQHEIICIQSMTEDGGKMLNMDRLEDAIIDFHQGLNDYRKTNATDYVPIKEAIFDTFDCFLEEQKKMTIRSDDGDCSPVHCNDAVRRLAAGFLEKVIGQQENEQAMQSMIDIGAIFGLPREKTKAVVEHLGGVQGAKSLIQRTATPSSSTDDMSDIKATIERYLSCSDTEEEEVGNELKYRITAYFIGRSDAQEIM